MVIDPTSTGSLPRRPSGSEQRSAARPPVDAARGSSPSRSLVAALVLALTSTSGAAGLADGEPKLLPPEQAFRFSARALDAQTVEAQFIIARGHYLYRDRMSFALGPTTLVLTAPTLPEGKRKHDQFFGDVETYREVVNVRLKFANGTPGQAIVVKADSQGCAEEVGICYPPTVQEVKLRLPVAGAGPGARVDAVPQKKSLFN
jgi:thiol:disulfide interchange protein DsbD